MCKFILQLYDYNDNIKSFYKLEICNGKSVNFTILNQSIEEIFKN